MLKVRGLSIFFERVRTIVRNILEFTFELAPKDHEHPYETTPWRTYLLRGKNDFALKDHRHPDLITINILNDRGAYVAEDVEFLEGYKENFFAKRDHTHDELLPRGNSDVLRVLKFAQEGSTILVVNKKPVWYYYLLEVDGNEKVVVIGSAGETKDGWKLDLLHPLPRDVYPGEVLKGVNLAFKAEFVTSGDILKTPKDIFVPIDHRHDDLYVKFGERVHTARTLSNVDPKDIAPEDHFHEEYLTQAHIPRYKPKNALAEKALKVNGSSLKIIHGGAKPQDAPSTLSTSVRVDLWEASEMDEMPTRAYALSLSPQIDMDFFYDIEEVVNYKPPKEQIELRIDAAAIAFLEELRNVNEFFKRLIPQLKENLFTLRLYRTWLFNVVARHSVRIGERITAAFFVPGGSEGWQNFERYTVELQQTVFAKAGEVYVVTKEMPDLMRHFQARLVGIFGDGLLVENRGFPYTIVAFTTDEGVIRRESTGSDLGG